MSSPERFDAFALFRRFRTDEALLGDALGLYVDRPDYGFVWMAYDDDAPCAVISATLGISTAAGGLAATLRDCYVDPQRRRRGIASALLLTLHARLDQLDVKQIDAIGETEELAAFFLARTYRISGGAFTLRR